MSNSINNTMRNFNIVIPSPVTTAFPSDKVAPIVRLLSGARSWSLRSPGRWRPPAPVVPVRSLLPPSPLVLLAVMPFNFVGGPVSGLHQRPVGKIDLESFLVASLEVLSDRLEVRDLSPAGLGGARTRHSVTLAHSPHCLFHSLEKSTTYNSGTL